MSSTGLIPGRDTTPGSTTLLAAVFRTLDETGLPWAVLRGGEDSVARGGDVDVLMAQRTLDAARAGLGRLGMAAVPSAGQGSHRFFVGFCERQQRWVRLDVTTSVDFGAHQEYVTDVAGRVLERRVRVDRRWQLCDDDAFWHMFLHRLLGNRDIESVTLSLMAFGASSRGPLAGMIDSLDAPGSSASRLLTLVRAQRWPDLADARPGLVRSWRRANPGSALTRVARRADRAGHALVSLRHPTGIAITTIGPDGAGKTTLAEGLRERLPFPSRYVYMGVWREYPWDRWIRVVPGARLVMRMGRLGYRTAQARYHRTRGRIVLLDRFTYDVLLPSADLDWRGRITAWLVRRLCAEPELVIVLDAPAELMWERKHEQGIEELERRRLTYLQVADSREFSIVIDARQTIEQVRDQAERAIWARLRQHWDESA